MLLTDLGIDTTDADNTTFQTARVCFINAEVQNIERRFADTNVMKAMAVLDLSSIPKIPSFYGMTEMETLATHYIMDLVELLWQGFIEIVSPEMTDKLLTGT